MRKTDSVIRPVDRGGINLNGILKPFRMIERTHLLSVNFSYCSTKKANLPPTLECPDLARLAVERVSFQNFVEEEASLEEGNCLELQLLLRNSFLLLDVRD